MLIGIEAERANTATKTGVEHYAKQVILHLAHIDRQNNYVLYLRTKPEQWIVDLPANFSYKVLPFPIFWTQLRISWEMLWHAPDVLFIPASSMPLIHPQKTVVTVHDLAFIFFPETYTAFQRNFHKVEDFLVKLFAWRVIAVSESTKNDLHNIYGIENSRIAVVHHGYEEQQIEAVRRSGEGTLGSLPAKYILFLSTLQPRKNLPGLISAFRQLKQEHKDLPHKLVVVGKPGWMSEESLAAIQANQDIVVYLNYLADADRWTALRQADLLVLPSFYEGFGMQILEAFEVGVPVITANVSSMPEVAGQAALYFDPTKPEEIKNAIEQVLHNPGVRADLEAKGKERLRLFSWEKCAKETLAVLQGGTIL